jgi:hypothetical protein
MINEKSDGALASISVFVDSQHLAKALTGGDQ